MSISSVAGFKAMCGCFTGLTVIAVTLRFVARKKNNAPLLADDWFMLAALILFLGNMTTVFLLLIGDLVARVNFSGYDGGEGSNKTNIFVQQVTLAFQLIIVWTLAATKASALFFYKRIFCPNRRANAVLRIIVIVTLLINACWVVGFFFLGLFQCGDHFSYGGDHFEYCTHLNEYQLGFYISDIILDVWIMIMPIPYIIRLKISRLKKWSTSIIFLLSFVGLGASIARLINYLQTPQVHPGAIHNTSGGGHERHRSAWTTYTWFGTLEMGAAIVAINLPTLYGLFAKNAPEALLRITRSWTSVASRAFSSSGSNVGHRRGSVGSGQHSMQSKEPNPVGIRSFVEVDNDHVPSVYEAPANEIHVRESVEMSSEKTRGEV